MAVVLKIFKKNRNPIHDGIKFKTKFRVSRVILIITDEISETNFFKILLDDLGLNKVRRQ